MQNHTRQHTTHERDQRAVPPDQLRSRMDQAPGLPGEHRLEQTGAFAKQDAEEGSADADEGRPEHDPREILMTDENQPQAREQRQGESRDLASDVHARGGQPRPTYGIFVAMTVMKSTFASSGNPAI